MKRAIITIIEDTCGVVYTAELRPDRIYTIKYVDGDWIEEVKAGGQE